MLYAQYRFPLSTVIPSLVKGTEGLIRGQNRIPELLSADPLAILRVIHNECTKSLGEQGGSRLTVSEIDTSVFVERGRLKPAIELIGTRVKTTHMLFN